MEYITFVNDTPLPVIVETWNNTGVQGLSRMTNITVNEYQELDCIFLPENTISSTLRSAKITNTFAEGDVDPKSHSNRNVIYSITGEWYINSLFTNNEILDKWKKHNLPQTMFGKFRSSPCIRGNYCWMFTDKNFNMFFDSKNKKIHFYVKPDKVNENECGSP